MIRKAGNDPQIQQTQFQETEHTSSRERIPEQIPETELERPSRSDSGRSQRAESLLTERGQQAQLQRQLLDQRADAIHQACEGLGTDEEAVYKNLSGLSEGQRKELNQIYQQKYGVTLEQEIRGEMSGPELDKALNLLNAKDPKRDIPDLEHRSTRKERPVSPEEAALRAKLDPLLVNGSRGPQVQQMQSRLNEWRAANGKPPIGQDGIFGKETEAALREFQAANGLKADGIAGPKTNELLASSRLNNIPVV
jgi:hypothetical protein